MHTESQPSILDSDVERWHEIANTAAETGPATNLSHECTSPMEEPMVKGGWRAPLVGNTIWTERHLRLSDGLYEVAIVCEL